jgi:hypothetical protein
VWSYVKTRNGHSTNSTTDKAARTCTNPKPGQLQQQLAPSLAVAHVQQSGRKHSTHAANTPVSRYMETQTPQSAVARALPTCDAVIVHVVVICCLCPACVRERIVLCPVLPAHACHTRHCILSCRPLSCLPMQATNGHAEVGEVTFLNFV